MQCKQIWWQWTKGKQKYKACCFCFIYVSAPLLLSFIPVGTRHDLKSTRIFWLESKTSELPEISLFLFFFSFFTFLSCRSCQLCSDLTSRICAVFKNTVVALVCTKPNRQISAALCLSLRSYQKRTSQDNMCFLLRSCSGKCTAIVMSGYKRFPTTTDCYLWLKD